MILVILKDKKSKHRTCTFFDDVDRAYAYYSKYFIFYESEYIFCDVKDIRFCLRSVDI